MVSGSGYPQAAGRAGQVRVEYSDSLKFQTGVGLDTKLTRDYQSRTRPETRNCRPNNLHVQLVEYIILRFFRHYVAPCIFKLG